MQSFEKFIDINAPIEKVFHFHDDTANLLRITPPDVKVELISMSPAGNGQKISLGITQFGFFKSRWDVEVIEYQPPVKMIDRQVKGPFHSFVQTRNFTDLGNGKTRMTDHVDYELPLNGVGNFFAGNLVAGELKKMFTYRHQRTKEILETGK